MTTGPGWLHSSSPQAALSGNTQKSAGRRDSEWPRFRQKILSVLTFTFSWNVHVLLSCTCELGTAVLATGISKAVCSRFVVFPRRARWSICEVPGECVSSAGTPEARASRLFCGAEASNGTRSSNFPSGHVLQSCGKTPPLWGRTVTCRYRFLSLGREAIHASLPVIGLFTLERGFQRACGHTRVPYSLYFFAVCCSFPYGHRARCGAMDCVVVVFRFLIGHLVVGLNAAW